MSTIQESLSSGLVQEQQEVSHKTMIDRFCRSFMAKIRPIRLFRIIFINLAILEVIFGGFILSRGSPFAHACLVTVIFFTLFSYFITLAYFKTRQEEEYALLIKNWEQYCQRHSMTGSQDLSFLSDATHELLKELKIRPVEKLFLSNVHFKGLCILLTKLNIWSQWKSYLKIKHSLLKLLIHKHLELIQYSPLDKDYHLALGQHYLTLSDLYKDFFQVIGISSLWIPKAYQSETMKHYYLKQCQRALESYSTINDFVEGQNIDVLKCMAILHQRLNHRADEMRTYEQILKLAPDHQESLFQLGNIYFELGHRAKGLQIYLTLNTLDKEKSKQLIAHFGWDELQEEDLI